MANWRDKETVEILSQSGASVSCDATTNENILATYTLPGGKMGPNDIVEMISLWSFTNSANNKSMFHRFGGTNFAALVQTTTARLQNMTIIRAANSLVNQVGFPSAVVGMLNISNSAATTGTVNTAADVVIQIIGQKASAGETLTLLGYSIVLRRAG